MQTPTEALLRGFVDAPASPLQSTGQPAQAASREVRQGFKVGELGLMIRYEDSSELTDLPAVYRLPAAPGWLLGVANLHGMLVPVFDLAVYLGLSAGTPGKPMLLVLSHGPDAAGVVIDGLPQRLRFGAADAADALTAPASLFPHLRGAAVIGDRLWFDLDRPALLAAFEASLSTSH